MYLTEETIRRYDELVERLTSELGLRNSNFSPFTVQEAFAEDLRHETNARRNIVGFGYGEKLVHGVPQGVLAIAMYVVRKAAPEDIHVSYRAESLIQRYTGSISYLSDVIEVGRPRLFHHTGRSYSERIPGGAEIGDSKGKTQGTLGGWVFGEDGNRYLLSCWHCIDGVQGGGIGNDVRQPPRGRSIATIAFSSDPTTCPPGTTTIDASLAKIDDLNRVGDFVLQIGEIRGMKKVRTTYVGVRKFGVKTHLTRGGIIQLGANLHLTLFSGQSKLYEKQLLIQPDPTAGLFATDGDSGSLIIDDNHQVVGLLVGGEDAPPKYIATPITDVLNFFWDPGVGNLKFLAYS